MDVLVPDIGDFKDVPVIEVLVKPGDRVEKDAPLLTLESDKATMEIPSPAGGVVRSVAVKVGDLTEVKMLLVRKAFSSYALQNVPTLSAVTCSAYKVP